MVTVLTGRGTVLEYCTCGIPVVNPSAHIKISWVSGHDGAAGNEQADTEVKKVVEEGSNPGTMLPVKTQGDELLTSLTAAGAAFKVQWRTLLAGSPW